MERWLPGLMWAGIILFGGAALLTQNQGPASWGPFLAVCGACVAGLIWAAVRRRRLKARLPEGLRGLWYRAGRDRIEFHWRWSADGGRLRILRSESTTIRSADDAVGGRDGVVCVYDGYRDGRAADEDLHAADEGLHPGASYRYAFFVGDRGGRWSRPVRQTIAALSPKEAAHVEATYRPSPVRIPGAEQRSTLGKTLVPDPLYDPHGTDVEWGRRLSGTTPDGMGGVASIASEVASGAIIDGVFDLLGTLPPDKLSREGWVEVV